MHKRTLIMAGFIAVTVLQGISYPAIALADDPTITQPYSASQPAGETQSSNGVENDASSDTSHDVASQTPMPSPKTTQSDTTTQSETEAQPDAEAQSEEASGKSAIPVRRPTRTRRSSPLSHPSRPNRKTAGIRTSSTTTRTASWPSARMR